MGDVILPRGAVLGSPGGLPHPKSSSPLQYTLPEKNMHFHHNCLFKEHPHLTVTNVRPWYFTILTES